MKSINQEDAPEKVQNLKDRIIETTGDLSDDEPMKIKSVNFKEFDRSGDYKLEIDIEGEFIHFHPVRTDEIVIITVEVRNPTVVRARHKETRTLLEITVKSNE